MSLRLSFGGSPTRAAFLDGLLRPDDVRNLLWWLNDPSGFRTALSPEEWVAFVALCPTRAEI